MYNQRLARLFTGALTALVVTSCAALPRDSVTSPVGVPVVAPAPSTPLQPGAPSIAGCRMLPGDSILNTRVDTARVHPRSAAMVSRFSAVNPGGLLPGASSYVWEGSRAGIPLNIGGTPTPLGLDGSWGQPMARFTAPVPATPRLEGEPGAAWDRHLLVLDPATCHLDEHINYRWDLLRGWVTGGSVRWDLRSNSRPTPFVAGGGAAEAAGLPIAPLSYRYDEVARGEVRHPVRFVAPNIGSRHVWPANHSDGRDTHADSLPMGSRLRLRPDFDLSSLGPQARVVATAMQRYGIVAADTGPAFCLTGEGDPRWDSRDLATLSRITARDFQVVDVSGWMVSPGSLQARPG